MDTDTWEGPSPRRSRWAPSRRTPRRRTVPGPRRRLPSSSLARKGRAVPRGLKRTGRERATTDTDTGGMYTYRHRAAVDAHRRDETREGGIGLFGRASQHAHTTHTHFLQPRLTNIILNISTTHTPDHSPRRDGLEREPRARPEATHGEREVTLHARCGARRHHPKLVSIRRLGVVA